MGFASSFLKYKKNFFLFWKIFKRFGARNSISPDIRTFSELGKFSSKIWEVFWKSYISWNIRKAFLWENTRKFLFLGLESSISQNIRKTTLFRKYKKRKKEIRVVFLCFLSLENSICWTIRKMFFEKI